MYGDLVRNEEDPQKSHSLQTLQNLELESRGFNMFIDFKEIETKQTRKVFLPLTKTRCKNHSSHQFQADAQTNFNDRATRYTHNKSWWLPMA